MKSILPLNLKNTGVRKRGKTILEDISLSIAQTGLTVVMGPNGAGKTTLLRLIHGLERPHSGSVEWSCDKSQALTRQAFVFQTPMMMRRSVRDNIAYPLVVRGNSKSTARAKAATWLKEVGLEERQHLDAKKLSGGERQKLAIARALITEPEIVFLDEPTTNLDGRSTREIETILQATSQGGTRIVMTTHNIGQAKRLATEVVFLNKGKLCDHSAAQDFFGSSQSQAAQDYLNGDIVE